MRRLSASFLLLSLLLAAPAGAQDQPPLGGFQEKLTLAHAEPVPAASAAPYLERAETYLNGLKTAKARFVQTSYAYGKEATGDFYLNRPGKLRFEYDPPAEDFIVADGLFIYYYDAELGEQSNAPIGTTLADFILRDNLTLTRNKDLKVEEVSRKQNHLFVRLTQREDPGLGSVTLVFTEEPFALRMWRVVDAQGAVTDVELSQLQTGVAMDKSLFIWRNPNRKPLNN